MGQQRSRRRSSGGGRRKNGPSSRGRRRSPVDHQEIEWQFDAADLEPVEAWLKQHSSNSGLVVEPESDERVADTYYDSEDWRFYRAGYALRVRNVGGVAEATMKSISPADGNVRRRREISEPLTDDKPSTLNGAKGPVGGRARSLLGGRKLVPIFEVRTRRRTFGVLLEAHEPSENGEPDGTAEERVRIGAVMLDETEVPLDGSREAARLGRVEIEAGAGTAPTPDLRGLVDEMQYALDLDPAQISKFEAGLYATGSTPRTSEDTGPTRIDATMSLGEVAFAVLRRQFAALRAHEPGTRIGEDPEELHDMRVATRRMRAAIKVFEGALPERAKWLREELRWLAQVLGEVRDLDVQEERFERWIAKAAEDDVEHLRKILGGLGKRREGARKDMLKALDSVRYERLETSFAEMLRRGPGAERELAPSGGAAGEPVTKTAPDLISARYRKWRKAAKKLAGDSPAEAFHDVRKKGKKLRYALEFVAEVYGGPVKALIKPLKAVQDDLGDHQDAVVAAETLRELGTTDQGRRVTRRAAFTMGIYHERCREQAARLRSCAIVSKPFRSLVRGKGWKGFEAATREAAKDPQRAAR